MISISRWFTAPFALLRRKVLGTRWVEPWNEVTVAVYASLNPAPPAAEAPAYGTLSTSYIPVDPPATPAASSAAKSSDRGREAA